MKRKVIILPLDGILGANQLFKKLDDLLDLPGLGESLAYIKLNDGVHNADIGGPNIVASVKATLNHYGLSAGIFLDLKIYDVSATLVNTLKKYSLSSSDILTVSSACSVEGITDLRKLLPGIKLAMISTLTDIGRSECLTRFGQSPEVKIYNDLMNIREVYFSKLGDQNKPEPFDLVVCSPHELPFLKRNLPDSYGFIVPGIRDVWMTNPNEHQKRITGVRKALDSGATYVVMGAQMTKGNPERDVSPEQSRLLTKNEIELAKGRFVVPGDPLETLKLCGGYYKSPQDKNGKILGPLVAYAGKYLTGIPTSDKNYVGAEYFNFARAEAEPSARSYFAGLIGKNIVNLDLKCDVVVGAPMGGILLAGAVGEFLGCRTIFAEKRVIAVAEMSLEGSKEVSEQILNRHEMNPGENVIVMEDVCNNFSTTQKLKELIEKRGGKLVGIACAFNRSGKTEWEGIPVVAAHYIPTKQFKQDDPEVVELMEAKKIVWNPKNDWDKLQKAMEG